MWNSELYQVNASELIKPIFYYFSSKYLTSRGYFWYLDLSVWLPSYASVCVHQFEWAIFIFTEQIGSSLKMRANLQRGTFLKRTS